MNGAGCYLSRFLQKELKEEMELVQSHNPVERHAKESINLDWSLMKVS